MGKKIRGLLLLTFAACMGICGCGRGQEEKEMGRYVEEKAGVPSDLVSQNEISAMRVLDDGTLICVADNISVSASVDNGSTWEDKYLLDIGAIDGEMGVVPSALSVDGKGNVFFVYNRYKEKEEKKGVRFRSTAELWTFDGKNYTRVAGGLPDLVTAGMKKKYTEAEKWEQAYAIALQQGFTKDTEEGFRSLCESLEIGPEIYLSFGKKPGADEYVKSSQITEQNIFLLTKDSEILQLDRSTGEKLFTYSVGVTENGLWTPVGDFLYVKDSLGFRIFDTRNGEEKNNDETKLLTEKGDASTCYSIGGSADGKMLYIAGAEGLYGHETGGTSYTPLMEGTMSSLFMPEKHFRYLLPCGDGDFYMSIRNGGKADGIRFAYHEEMPRYPEKKLSVYSLEKMNALDKCIAQFQAQNPEVYVSYTWGKSGNDAVTTSDALKVLNTKILAGEGPDVIFLDDMPVGTYISNGMLENLNGLVETESRKGEVFEGLLQGIREDGETYAVPLLFDIPMLIGRESEIGEVKTAEELYRLVERIASDKKDKAMVTDIHDGKEMLATMFIGNGKALFKEDGTLEPKELESFLDLSKKTYDLAQANVSYSILMEEEADEEFYAQLGLTDVLAQVMESADAADTVHTVLDHVPEIYFGKIHFSMGVLNHMQDLVDFATAVGTEGSEVVYRAIPGSSQNCYIGKNFIGINSLSREKESAEKFLSYMISGEGQQGLLGNYLAFDFSINKKYFDSQLRGTVKDELGYRAEDEENRDMLLENEDGTTSRAPMVIPGEDFYQGMEEFVSSLSEPMYSDTDVYNSIVNMGMDCMKGKKNVEQTTEAIVDKMDLFLSE